MRQFFINGQVVLVSESDLEDIRRAVLLKLKEETKAPYPHLQRELENAIPILGPHDSRLGRWALTEKETRLALVRIPSRNDVNYIWVAILRKDGADWVVEKLVEERILAR
jgi:hypothetical protein